MENRVLAVATVMVIPTVTTEMIIITIITAAILAIATVATNKSSMNSNKNQLEQQKFYDSNSNDSGNVSTRTFGVEMT